MQWTVDELIARFNALPVGNTQGTITNLCAINPGVVGGISVCLSPEEHAAIYTTKATAVLVSQSFRPKKPIYTATLLGVEDPYGCFRSLWKEAYVENVHARKGIEFPSYIGEKVEIGKYVYRGAFSYIGDGVVIGEGVKIFPHVYIGNHVRIGEGTILYSGVKIYPFVTIGKRCTIHAGAVIGAVYMHNQEIDRMCQYIYGATNVSIPDETEIAAKGL